ncbi:hypothetical protein HN747_01920 [archaeon]|jgi:hypothetical protein|nr:hypothetical protein [archaeon]
MTDLLTCLADTTSTIVTGRNIYFSKETHFSVKKFGGGYIIRTSSNGHKCCNFSAQGGEKKIIGTSYEGGIQIYDNVMLPMNATEKIKII